MKKEIKKNKIKPRTKVETKRDHLEVILERMEHKSDLLSEGFLGLDKKIEELNKKVDANHKETNDNFKTLFKFRNETNDNFKVSLEYLSKIDDEIQSIKKEIIGLKDSLKNKANLDKLLQLEKRVIVIERELAYYRKS